jgi:hypothetical protein
MSCDNHIMPNRSSRRDTNTLAFDIVQQATGQAKPEKEKDPAAVALGRKGGLKGGRARADLLTPERRMEIAKNAAAKRWKDRL